MKHITFFLVILVVSTNISQGYGTAEDAAIGTNQEQILVKMKTKNNTALLSLTNLGDRAIFEIRAEASAIIEAVKVRGWQGAIMENGFAMLKTDDKPLLRHKSLIILLKTDVPVGEIQLSVFNTDNKLIATDSLVSHEGFLTANAWMTPTKPCIQHPCFAPDIYYWSFSPTGEVEWLYTSNYSDYNKGLYRIVPYSDSSGIIFIIFNPYDFEQTYNQVLGYDIQSGNITIALKQYIKTDKDPFVSFAKWPPLTISKDLFGEENKKSQFPIWSRITEKKWIIESNDDSTLRVLPQELTFFTNGNYEAMYSNECKFSGTFNVTKEADIPNNILFFVPERDCDPRGYNSSFIWGASIGLTSEGITLNDVPYS
jgi:hypothetical protein